MTNFLVKIWNTIQAYGFWGKIRLVKLDDPILGQVADPVHFDNPVKSYWLAQKMFKLMKAERGIGLAGPQCGVPLRIFVMYIERNRYVCINPAIIKTHGDKEVDKEGCLSFPGEEYNIPRFPELYVKYQSISGRVIHETMTGIKARCFQHELDHLNGITFHKRMTHNY